MSRVLFLLMWFIASRSPIISSTKSGDADITTGDVAKDILRLSTTPGSTDIPRLSTTTGSTDNPRLSTTTGSTDNPRLSTTTGSTDNPRLSITTGSTDNPRLSTTTGSTDNPRLSTTTGSLYNPRLSTTTGFTDNPRLSTTTGSLYNPRLSTTTGFTDNPRLSTTTRSTDNPRLSTTTGSTDIRRLSTTTGSTDNPPLSTITVSTDNTPLSTITGSTDNPPQSTITGSTDNPPLSTITGSTDNPPLSTIPVSIDNPRLSTTTGSTDNPTLSTITGSTDNPRLSTTMGSSDNPRLSTTTGSTDNPRLSTTTGSSSTGSTDNPRLSTTAGSTSTTTGSTSITTGSTDNPRLSTTTNCTSTTTGSTSTTTGSTSTTTGSTSTTTGYTSTTTGSTSTTTGSTDYMWPLCSTGSTSTTTGSTTTTTGSRTTTIARPSYKWPLPVADVEEIIRNSIVNDLLDTYTNMEQRAILFRQLTHCPHTSLCQLTVSDRLRLSTPESCCTECSCDPSCVKTYNCCPDLVKLDTNELPLSDRDAITRPVCIPSYLKRARGAGDNGILAIAKCQFNSDPYIASLCIREYTVGTLSFPDIVPVTHTEGGVIYRNQFCAFCNNVDQHELVYWNVQLNIFSASLMISSETEAINLAVSNTDVELIYNSMVGPATPSCLPGVESGGCNITGRWTAYDDNIARACQFYDLPYRTDTNLYYENVFCAVCNGYNPDAASCMDSSSHPSWPSFSVLLKTSSPVTEPGTDTSMQCAAGYVEDKLKGTCHQLHCLNMKWLSNGKCERLYDDFTGTLYTATARVTPLSIINLSQANQMAEDIITWFSMVQSEILHPDGMSIWCDAQLLYISDSTTEYPTADSRLIYYDVRFGIYIVSHTHPDDIIKKILNIEDKTINLNSDSEHVFHIRFIENLPVVNFDIASTVSNQFNDAVHDAKGLSLPVLLDIHKQITHTFPDMYSVIPHIRKNVNMAICDSGKHVPVTRLKSCPVLKLSRETHNWTVTSNGIFFPEIRQYINNTDFFFEIYDTLVVVCADYFLSKEKKFLQESNAIKTDESAEGILTVVSLSVSLICLLLAFITFCLFPVLRTLPGMNNMALIASLFIAQVLFMVGMYGGLDTVSTACKTIGLLIHLFWLLTLIWMNVCTFHVFRLFALTMHPLSKVVDYTRFSYYTMYCVGVSGLFVAINIVVSLVTSEGSDMGYGVRICYISSPKMVGFTFGVPVALVVLSNMCMFVTAIVKIRRTRRVENTMNQRNDIVVFAKLSSLTGVSWLFGLLFDWTSYVIFSYLFIALNASQGLLLFLSFVCNRRVYNLYKSRITHVELWTRNSRNTETTKT